jgi:flavorubredoxin
MRPFKQYVLEALALYDKLEIKTIAPLHGPVLRNNPMHYVELYRKWSSDTRFSKRKFGDKMISIFYISSYENTQKMAEYIYEGAESVEGLRASMFDLASLDHANMIDLLEESDGVLIGSPTINGDAVKPAWDLLAHVSYIQNSGKVGGVFGSYGWTGEAGEMLTERMRGLKFRVPLEPMKIKLIPTPDELESCFAFGKEFAEIVNGKMVEITL